MTALSITLPTVGGSEDTWGTTLNADLQAISDFIGPLDSSELAVLDGITATTAQLNATATFTAAGLALMDDADAAAQRTTLGLGTAALTASTAYATAAQGATADAALATADAALPLAGGTMTGALIVLDVTSTADNDGTASGTYTPTPVGGNYKSLSNAGAFTFAAPSVAGSYTLLVEMSNAAGAGAVTFSGFSKVAGDALTTTVGNRFQVFITKTSNGCNAVIGAMQ